RIDRIEADQLAEELDGLLLVAGGIGLERGAARQRRAGGQQGQQDGEDPSHDSNILRRKAISIKLRGCTPPARSRIGSSGCPTGSRSSPSSPASPTSST